MDSSKKPETLPLHRHLQNLWTNFNNVLNHRVTIFSFSLPNHNNNNNMNVFPWFFGGDEKKNRSLTTYEIKNRMLGTSVYKISDDANNCVVLKSKSDREPDGKIELYCVSKTDAEGFLKDVIGDDDEIVVDTPLAHVVEFEGRVPPISLVPELTQVKNAIELKNKGRKKKLADLSFSGVPLFQSDCVLAENGGTYYNAAFFRKEDLEKTIDTVITRPEERDAATTTIEVLSFEDIIQKMKDNSRSEWNDIIFVGPGEKINMIPGDDWMDHIKKSC